MAFKYHGPADFFSYKGHYYKPGDTVPMTKDEVEHHVRQHHQFEGVDLADLEAAEPLVVAGKPMDDRGQEIEAPEPRRATAPVAAAAKAD